MCLKHTFLCFLIHTKASVHQISLNRHAVCPRSVALRTSKNKRGINCPDRGAVSLGRLLGWRCEGPMGISVPPPSGPQFAEVGELFPGKDHTSQDPWLCHGSQTGVFQPGQHLHRHVSSVISRHCPSFECARELQRCWQTFKVSLDSLSCGLYPGSSPAVRRDPGHGTQQQRVPSMAEGWGPASGTTPLDRPGTEAPPVDHPGGEVSLH